MGVQLSFCYWKSPFVLIFITKSGINCFQMTQLGQVLFTITDLLTAKNCQLNLKLRYVSFYSFQ